MRCTWAGMLLRASDISQASSTAITVRSSRRGTEMTSIPSAGRTRGRRDRLDSMRRMNSRPSTKRISPSDTRRWLSVFWRTSNRRSIHAILLLINSSTLVITTHDGATTVSVPSNSRTRPIRRARRVWRRRHKTSRPSRTTRKVFSSTATFDVEILRWNTYIPMIMNVNLISIP